LKAAEDVERDSHRQGLILGLVAVALFSLTLPATRAAVTFFSPWFVASGRAVVAGLLALGIIMLFRSPLPNQRQWGQLAIIALGVVFGFPFFTTWAMQHVPAAHGAVVLALLPLATALAGALVAHERPSRSFWLVAVAGSALVVWFALSRGGGGLHAADWALVAAIASAALGYALGARVSRELGGWQTISWALVLSLPINMLVSALNFPANIRDATSLAWSGFAYVSVFSMYVGFFPWYRALALGGIARIGQVQLLQPFMTFAAAALWLGESIDPTTLIFAAAVASLVALGQRMTVVVKRP